uniref:ribosome assembly protein METTL17, mitochondrial-like isoform X3 n=1 Tax=Myxine glutinosa TaxID=7769 RepID=UPI00358DDFF6
MPQPLKELTRTLGKKYPMSSISDEIAGFTNYLLKRKLPVEDTALQVSAMKIEEEVRKQCCIWQAGWMAYLQQQCEYLVRLKGGFQILPRTLLWTLVPELEAAFGGEEIKRPLIRGVHFHTVLPPKVHCDVVVATYTLSELPGMKERVEAVCSLWKKTKCFLVLIENGTRSGHDVILEARDTLIKESRNGITENCDGYVFAPCPHEQQCPLPQQTKPLPCSFVQKYHPFPFPWNEPIKVEKFSFLIFSRGQKAVDQDWPRIVQPVLCRARHVHCHLCCADGTFQHAIITRKKHGRDVYRTTRACTWGDRLPVKLLPQEDNAVEEE